MNEPKRLGLPEELLEHLFNLMLHGLVIFHSLPEKSCHFLDASGLLFDLVKPTTNVSGLWGLDWRQCLSLTFPNKPIFFRDYKSKSLPEVSYVKHG